MLVVFMYSTPYSGQLLFKLEFSQQSFEKPSNIKLHDIPSTRSKLSHANRRRDRHDETNNRFSEFFKIT